MNNRELELIHALAQRNIITREELKKAELYLALSPKVFNDYRQAIDWLMLNRAVSRDRQEAVEAAFLAASLTETTAKATAVPATAPTEEKQKPLDLAPPSQQSPLHSPNSKEEREIYEYNLSQLQGLIDSGKISVAKKPICREKLKGRYYLFCDVSELMQWIGQGYPETMIEDAQTELSTHTLVQLYQLTKLNAVTHDEYVDCYYELAWAEQHHFTDETELFHWLAQNDCLHHPLTDIKQAQHYNVSLNKLTQLLLEGKIDFKTHRQLSERMIKNSDQLPIKEPSPDSGLENITEKKVVKRKSKRRAIIFILLLAPGLYKFADGLMERQKPHHYPVTSLKKQNGSQKAGAKAKSTESMTKGQIDAPNNDEFNAAVRAAIEKNIKRVDTIIQRKWPSQVRLQDRILSISVAGPCHKDSQSSIVCPIDIKYSLGKRTSHVEQNLRLNARFVYDDDKLIQRSLNDFIKEVVNGIKMI